MLHCGWTGTLASQRAAMRGEAATKIPGSPSCFSRQKNLLAVGCVEECSPTPCRPGAPGWWRSAGVMGRTAQPAARRARPHASSHQNARRPARSAAAPNFLTTRGLQQNQETRAPIKSRVGCGGTRSTSVRRVVRRGISLEPGMLQCAALCPAPCSSASRDGDPPGVTLR